MTDMLRTSAGQRFFDHASPDYSKNRVFRLLNRWRLVCLAQVLDVMLILGVALLLYPISGGIIGEALPRYVFGALAAAAMFHFSFAQAHLYSIYSLLDEPRAIRSVIIRWSFGFLVLAAGAALLHQPGLYSRLWFLSFYVGGGIALATQRAGLAALVRSWIRRGYSTQSVLLIGQNELAGELIQRLEGNRSGIRVRGIYDDCYDGRPSMVRGVPVQGTVSDLLDYAKTNVTDLVVITLPIAATEQINSVISRLRQQPLNIRVLPGSIGLDRVSPIKLSRADLPGVQLIAVADRPISEFPLFVKGAIDRVAAFFGLLAVLPLLLVCATGIAMTSPGPVLFRQRRIGYKGHEFNIIKFRTMDVTDHPHIRLTQVNDPRVFKFGSFLRKTSLDELPQLLNVLKGDMSLVGPRPHMPEARAAGKLYFEAVNEYAGRHRVKPGITGWAQVNGWRGPTETIEQIERRVEHDMYYIDNWSLTLDLVILLRTVFVGFFGKNAF